jgi:tRNA uridine 5-carbamoylmethylation protein Kti12
MGKGMICYFLVGVPGSGKSTVIKRFSEKHTDKDIRVFSQDRALMDFYCARTEEVLPTDEKELYAAAFRFMIAHQKEFDAFLDTRFKWALEAEVLFIDRTNTSKKSRRKYIAAAQQKGFSIIGIHVHVPLEIAINRQLSRDDKNVPIDVIRKMFFGIQEILVGAEADFIFHVDGQGSEISGSIYPHGL